MSSAPVGQLRVVDALVIGAGFGGIYQLKKLHDQGLDTALIDVAGDVGGTWFWNKYPGAMSDTESFLYRYSWDLEDLRQYPWDTHYIYQKDVLAYLRHVVERYDLRKHMTFNTALTAANWDDGSKQWIVQTSTGLLFRTRYLISALGLLSKQNLPDIPGINEFQGEKYHTGAWPDDVKLEGKRIGVIGNGSTGVQIITEVAKYAGHLTCFQRNPQFSVPSGQGRITPAYRQKINDNYPEIWSEAKDDSLFGFGFKEASRPTFSVSPDERGKIYEAAWKRGGGFRFMFETFGDISVDEAANNEATDFIKAKIRSTVRDPEKARKLMPTQLYARRPICDAGYYEQFNRANVDLVSLSETPITRMTPRGILTSDGTQHVLDVVIFATGFDAVDGNYARLAIQGRDGQTLKDHWDKSGPTSYLGISVPKFPNLFMILGPNSPFCNLPPAIESQVEFISDTIQYAEKEKRTLALSSGSEDLGRTNSAVAEIDSDIPPGSHKLANTTVVVEATPDAEKHWTEECDKLSAGSLFRKTDSWIFGSNVPGKKHSVLFYFAGLAAYRKVLRGVAEERWKEFVIT